MKKRDQGAWLTLNTSYYAAPLLNPINLLIDASALIESAHGVVQVIRDAVQLSPYVDNRAVAHALKAVETLMEMTAGCADVANARFEELGDSWLTRHQTDDYEIDDE